MKKRIVRNLTVRFFRSGVRPQSKVFDKNGTTILFEPVPSYQSSMRCVAIMALFALKV